MYDELKEPLIAKLVERLNTQGFNVSADTIKKAFTNFPQLIQKIQGLLAAAPDFKPESKEKLTYIVNLLTKAARGELSASDIETATGSDVIGSKASTSTTSKARVTEESDIHK